MSDREIIAYVIIAAMLLMLAAAVAAAWAQKRKRRAERHLRVDLGVGKASASPPVGQAAEAPDSVT